MQKSRSKLTYANVVSTLALFLAVTGGSALAVNQLAKNSVGSKQLKKNAVTTAKIKNRAVTGSKIAVSSLGTVPRAETAQSAANADALGGAPASSFMRSDRFFFGTGNPSLPTPQTLFVAGGIEVTTAASANATFKIRLVNKTSASWEFSNSSTNAVAIVPGGSAAEISPSSVRVATIVGRNVANPKQALLLQCGSDFSPNILDCFALLPPAP